MSESMESSAAETRRRQRATITGGESTLDDNSGYTREFQTDDQRFVLWNMANTGLTPRAVKPALRILGLFPSQEAALRHANQLANDPHSDKASGIRLSTTHEWYTIPESTERDVEACKAKVNRNLLNHQNMLQENATEFKTRHDALTAGRTPAIEQAKEALEYNQYEERKREKRKEFTEACQGKSDEEIAVLKEAFEQEMAEVAERHMRSRGRFGDEDEEADEAVKEEAEEEKEKVVEYVDPPLKPEVKPEAILGFWDSMVEEHKLTGGTESSQIPRVFDVRNQTYAVISVVPDYETKTDEDPFGKEPGVIVWAAFDTEDEALKYNKNVAAKKVRDYDLAIVTMYEWLYPHMMNSDGVNQLYRNEELNNIMKHARTSSKQVRDFEDRCRQENIECPTMELGPDLSEPAPHRYRPPVGSGIEAMGMEEEKN